VTTEVPEMARGLLPNLRCLEASKGPLEFCVVPRKFRYLQAGVDLIPEGCRPVLCKSEANIDRRASTSPRTATRQTRRTQSVILQSEQFATPDSLPS
jgi:hypothetical protein